jgi:uncharacterized protein
MQLDRVSCVLMALALLAGCGDRGDRGDRGEEAPQDGAVQLPRTLAWTAYNLGTTGDNQSVAIGNVLRDRYNVTLRVIPGQNDISRLLPLRTGRAQFSANGVATYFAQEGVFQFAHPDWGPQPFRLLMSSNGLSNLGLAVAADTGVRSIEQLRGRRVGWVRAAPALNVSTEAVLACGGLTWDDVVRVEFPGYEAMWTGIVNGDIDAAFASTVSGTTRRLEASPRGIHWPAMPHDDTECWNRALAVAPYYTRHLATLGAAIDGARPHEGGTYPYPILITTAAQDEALVHWLTRAIHEGYPRFRDADPGAMGWALEYQIFDWVVPYHDGAVRYWREIGVWNEALDRHQDWLIERQALLAQAWTQLTADADADPSTFESRWYRLRADTLANAGHDPVWQHPGQGGAAARRARRAADPDLPALP